MYTRTHKPIVYRLAYFLYHSLLALAIVLAGSLPLAATPSPAYPAMLPLLPVAPTLAARGRSLLTVQGGAWAFDRRHGFLAVARSAVSIPLAIEADAAGFLTLKQQDHIWSSNPASDHFTPALTGVNTRTVQQLWLENRGGSAVTLNGWSAPGDLAIASAAPLLLTGEMQAQGVLALHASQLTINADLRALDLRLAADDWVSIEADATLQARNGEQGGRIQVTGRLISSVGRLDATGDQGGVILLASEQLLQAGTIVANGATSAGGQVQLSFQHHYIATASSAISVNGAQSGGVVRLDGGDHGRLYSSGQVQALGMRERGGDLLLLGKEIVLNTARIDVSGVSGGRVRIGGGVHGRDPSLPNAQHLQISPATHILADAGAWGNGGAISLWADGSNEVQGRLSARGGRQGGDGGVIETSARHGLQTSGTIQLDAPAGKAGQWLIDPKHLTITHAPDGRFLQFALLDPTPNPGDQFGRGLHILSNGNIVVPDPNDDFGATDAGAVYLFDGFSGALLSTLTGASPSDYVGYDGVAALSNGNYVVCSSSWDNGAATDAGAVTWGNGASGVSGVVSAVNSLVGTQVDDAIGDSNNAGCSGVTVLTNGNYVVRSSRWDNGALVDAGAATWGNGSSGSTGALSPANSLVGGQVADEVSDGGITALSNGNYVVSSSGWDNGAVSDVGAVTWGDGDGGIVGVVSAANSLVGAQVDDGVGDVTALRNGNYVVVSEWWDNGSISNVGAVTWGNGDGGSTGVVSTLNSLVGSRVDDKVGDGGITPLTNGNYVISSPDCSFRFVTQSGAVTWANGASSSSGVVSAANSLVGATDYDRIGNEGVAALSNGNYVVSSRQWDNGAASDAGAVTWGNGARGSKGAVSPANSLVGTKTDDWVGGGRNVTPLTNGNYVIISPYWDNGAAQNAGAVTWGDGSSSSSGAVSLANSLVGTQSGDRVGDSGVTALTNGNYVVSSSSWNNGALQAAGAVTWVDGSASFSGIVALANSLVGDQANNSVGAGGVIALSNGNYVARSTLWDNGVLGNAGAVTWGNGASGVTGIVSAANSLVGLQNGDEVGGSGILPLHNGNYVVLTPRWDNGAAIDAGAATWVDGSTGKTLDGQSSVTALNSIIGGTSNSGLGKIHEDALHSAFVTSFTNADSGQVLIGFADPAQLVFRRGQGQAIAVTPDLLARTLQSGAALTLQANSDLTLHAPLLIDNANGNGGALTMQAGRSLALHTDLTSDNAPVTLVANATLAQGVVDSERDPGAAALTMAKNTTLNAGANEVRIELADGAGKSQAESGAITLQTVIGSGLIVKNLGTSPNSDLRLAGPVTTQQAQSYETPNGLTTVAADLTTNNAPIYLANHVLVQPGKKLDTGLLEAVELVGTELQTLQADGALLTHLHHKGAGTVRLLSTLSLNGYLKNSDGSFESNGQTLTVLGATMMSGGSYWPGLALQSFKAGLMLEAGATLQVELNGVAAGQHSTIQVSGGVELMGGTLQVVAASSLVNKSSVVIIENDGNDAVVGSFAGLPQGATFNMGGGSFQISYQGGDGNDVALTVVQAPPSTPDAAHMVYLPVINK